MNLDEAKFKFEERYYLWSKELLKHEFSDGFPLLKSVKGTLAQHYLRILEQLDKHQAYSMAYALMRRGTKKVILDKWDDTFTEEDQKYVDLYLQMEQLEDHKDAMQRSPFEFRKKRKFNRRGFRRYIKSALKPVLGDEYEKWGGGLWNYCTSIGCWKVRTRIDTGGRFDQLCYDHVIQITNVLRLCECTSLLHWFGITNQTDWNDLKDEDAESVAESLAKIVKYFLEAAPKLLEGLTLD